MTTECSKCGESSNCVVSQYDGPLGDIMGLDLGDNSIWGIWGMLEEQSTPTMMSNPIKEKFTMDDMNKTYDVSMLQKILAKYGINIPSQVTPNMLVKLHEDVHQMVKEKLLSMMPDNVKASLVGSLPPTMGAKVLSNIPEKLSGKIINHMDTKVSATVLPLMSGSQAGAIIQNLDPVKRDQIVATAKQFANEKINDMKQTLGDKIDTVKSNVQQVINKIDAMASNVVVPVVNKPREQFSTCNSDGSIGISNWIIYILSFILVVIVLIIAIMWIWSKRKDI